MKIKILHVLHSLRTGGLENGAVNLINHLDSSRFEHEICCIDESGPMMERIKFPVKVYSLGKGERRDYLLPIKLALAIKKARPDIVHTRNWATIDGVVGAKLAGVRRIIHGEHGREATDPTGANLRRRRLRKMLNPWISRFVTVSDDLKQWLINDVGIPEGKVVQIINGVDTDRFKPASDKTAAKTAMGLPPDSFVVGSVGRLDPVKDYPTLIRAFVLLVTGPPANRPTGQPVLLIIGSGPEEQNLKRLAKDPEIADKVYFMGERRDVPEVLQAMDVFVLPSIAEGISNTILEAMACGLPVVATQVGGNEELVAHSKTGTLFRPGDEAGLAAILSDYLHDSKMLDTHSRSGRQRVKEQFSLARMVDAYDKLYRSVAEG